MKIPDLKKTQIANNRRLISYTIEMFQQHFFTHILNASYISFNSLKQLEIIYDLVLRLNNLFTRKCPLINKS